MTDDLQAKIQRTLQIMEPLVDAIDDVIEAEGEVTIAIIDKRGLKQAFILTQPERVVADKDLH